VVVAAAAVKPAAPAPAAAAGPESETAEVSGPWAKIVRPQVEVPPQEQEVPQYWAVRMLSPAVANLQVVSNGEQAALQQMMESTFKSIKTRDRRSEVPTKLALVSAQRIENTEMWKRYAYVRYCIQQKRPHKCTPISSLGGDIVTRNGLPSANRTNSRLNEVYLWHGTSPHGATGISTSGFRLRYSGSNAGSMYGPGLYFAECSSKSDEYAIDDQEGIYKGVYCLLLCRVVLGETLRLTTGGEATHGMIKSAVESAAYDSVLGDREASVGTYREFVVFQEDQVYPEYLILYKRQ